MGSSIAEASDPRRTLFQTVLTAFAALVIAGVIVCGILVLVCFAFPEVPDMRHRGAWQNDDFTIPDVMPSKFGENS